MESHAEEIIKIINQQKKLQLLQQNDINKGYAEIFYDTVKFERKKLCYENFSMMVPVFFKIMPKEVMAYKYQSHNSPEFVYTNENTDINMTFSFVNIEELGDDITEVHKQMNEEIGNQYNSVDYLSNDILQTEQCLSIAHFSYPVAIKEEMILQIVFLFLIKDTWVFGTFHCPYTQKRDWNDIVKQMLLSIQLE
ncbi:hypothetical protein AAK894_06275 [Lachnospiraceae bacterium 46-61]